jgi:hypothetical protein
MWRHVDDAEMAENADKLADYLVGSREWFEIINVYFSLRKFVPLKAYYKRLRDKFTVAEMQNKFQEIFPRHVIQGVEMLKFCEDLP